jgi:soluble lytic murein transglycosylase
MSDLPRPAPSLSRSARPNPERRRRTLIAAAVVGAILAGTAVLVYFWADLERRRARNRKIVAKAAAAGGVPESLALAVAEAESGFDDRAVSYKGAVGLMQVMPRTGREVAGRLGLKRYDLRNPRDNARIGTAYLRELISRYRGDLHLALAAYNAGPRNVAKWRRRAGRGLLGSEVVKRCAFRVTRKYVARVLSARAKYRRKRGRSK